MRANLGEMVMKGYSTSPNLHGWSHTISVISRTPIGWSIIPLQRCNQCILPYLPTPPLGQDMTQGQFFKRSLTDLNSEFSFSETSCLTKLPHQVASSRLKKSVCPTIHNFPKGISAMRNAISLVQDLNLCRRIHFLRR